MHADSCPQLWCSPLFERSSFNPSAFALHIFPLCYPVNCRNKRVVIILPYLLMCSQKVNRGERQHNTGMTAGKKARGLVWTHLWVHKVWPQSSSLVCLTFFMFLCSGLIFIYTCRKLNSHLIFMKQPVKLSSTSNMLPNFYLYFNCNLVLYLLCPVWSCNGETVQRKLLICAVLLLAES